MEQFQLNKNQLRFIALLGSRPEKNLTVRETARRLNWPPSTASRIIRSLEITGLVSTNLRGRSKFISLNPSHPSINEVKILAIKHYGIIPEITAALQPMKSISLAVIYGSAAKGTLDDQSDIDILIVGTPDQDELNRRLEKIEKLIGREINYTLFLPKEFRQSIKKSPFLHDVMKQPTIDIIRQ